MTKKPTYKELEQRVRDLKNETRKLRRAEKALLESEAKFKNIVERSFDMIFTTDHMGHLTYISPAAERILHFKPEEMVGKHFKTFIAESEIPRVFLGITEILKSHKVAKVFQMEATRKDGGHPFVELGATSIYKNGEILGMQGAIRDITERNQATEALREDNDFYCQMAENIKAIIWMADPKSARILYVSPAYEDIWQHPIEALYENPKKWMETIYPDDIESVKANWGKQVQGHSTYDEFRVILPNGSIRWIANRSYPIKDEKGEIYKITGIAEDITENKQTIEGKERPQTQVQQVHNTEAIVTLARGIAHNFNNLLMGIQGQTSLLLIDQDSSQSGYEKLEEIEEYVKNAADLTKQLLAFAGDGKYETEPTDLNEIVRKTARMFGKTNKEIRIHKKFQKNVWAVEADPSQIEEVIQNVFLNAWHAMSSAGKLYIETENVILNQKDVSPFMGDPGKYVKIAVTDTGVGMDQTTQERIFEPFFTTKEMGRGTGLGLAFVYGIIKSHGGFTKVDSEIVKGTTINIYLPASGAKVIEEMVLAKDLMNGSETVLLVDDEDMIIEVGEKMLELLRYNSLIARSGIEAIEVYKKKKDHINIVILDIVMPVMNGGETYDRLKEINPDIKVLLASGSSITHQAAEILKRGCNGFIQKPFKLNEISKKIREILDQNQP